MKKIKNFIIDLYNKAFSGSSEKVNSRKLTQDTKAGKLDWSSGDEKFKEEPKNVEKLHLSDSKNAKTAHFKLPLFIPTEPFFKNRFCVEFPNIEEQHFSAYIYNGKNALDDSKLLTSTRLAGKNYYSTFTVLLTMTEICDKLLELESESSVGDIKINMLDATGVIVKTILLPECEVVDVRYFDDLSYGNPGDKKSYLLYGEIIIKHKNRKIF